MKLSVGARSMALIRVAVPSLLSAALLALAFPPFDLPLFAWVALVPLLLQLFHSKVFEGFAAGLLTGGLFFLALMWWATGLPEANPWNFTALVISLGLFFGLYAGMACWLLRHLPAWAPMTLPTLWVATEYLRTHVGFLSQAVGILGYSQHALLPTAAIAAYTGIYGVSFLLMTSNVVLALFLQRRTKTTSQDKIARRISPYPALHIGMTTLLIGWFAFQAIPNDDLPEEQNLSVAIVQGNATVDAQLDYQRYLREIFPVYEQLTSKVTDASLVVWPASSVPGILPGDRTMVTRLGELAIQSNAFLLVGAAGLDKFNTEQVRQKRIANSAFLFAPNGRLHERYDKIHLLPFDEYLPARGVIPWPEWVVSPGMTDHYAGKRLTVFKASQARFGVQICFENMFPEQIRQLALQGADFIVGQTNETYTTSMAAHYQNLAYYVFRAIENRMPVLRCSTNGISCIIDSTGRIVDSVKDATGREVDVVGVATADIPLGGKRSFYTRYGDLFAFFCLVGSLIFIIMAICKSFRRT